LGGGLRSVTSGGAGGSALRANISGGPGRASKGLRRIQGGTGKED